MTYTVRNVFFTIIKRVTAFYFSTEHLNFLSQEAQHLPCKMSFSRNKLRDPKLSLSLSVPKEVGFSPPQQSLVGPFQMLPHGVAVEHILVQFGQCLFTSRVVSLSSRIPT